MTKEKNPWGVGTPWKNSVAFFTYLRGCLRLAWKRHPTKLKVIKDRRKQIPNPNPKGSKSTVFGFTCEMCRNDFTIKECQVDHVIPAGSLQKKEDIQNFVENLLWVTEDDLRLVCKGCNSALAMAEKQGISYKDAILEKDAITWEKLNKGVKKQRDILEALGVENAQYLKGKDIRKAYVEYLKSEEGK
ncbi:HNH endonuclease [Vibrio phage 11895-B1]|uniref:HNH endonuclease n=1 Tax=Vibrio phage 11895-B1 TaxID=754075 RepID=UPI0002C080C8|nr:HNH endonuclease [Vibrio phage 11895-B1]AGH32068.1 hypothetical protein VPHG_00001 [Vibrio phage 11895-B1]